MNEFKSRDTQGLIDLIDYVYNIVHQKLEIIIIGSYTGKTAEVMLDTNKVDKIYCIDLWNRGIFKLMENVFDFRFKDDKRVVKHKGTIDTFFKQYGKVQNIDLIYIDADHHYENVKHDILTSKNYFWPYFIGGHDYNPKISQGGVIKAVNEIFRRPYKLYNNTSWIVKI